MNLDTLVIRPMIQLDLPEVLQIDSSNLSAWGISLFKQQLTNKHSFHFVVRSRQINELLAFICGHVIADEAEIHKIAVAPDWQRHGIASHLLHHVLESLQIPTIFLELRASNSAARNLYETFNFSSCGLRKKYYSSPPEDAIIMRLQQH